MVQLEDLPQVNYDAGRLAATFVPDDIIVRDFPSRVLQHHCLFSRVVSQRYRYCHLLFEELIRLHKVQFDGSIPWQLDYAESPIPGDTIGFPTSGHKYQFHAECWILQMRRTLDSVVQLCELCISHNKSSIPTKLESTGINSLLSGSGKLKKIFPIIMGSDTRFLVDQTSFLGTLNDLFNSMKHHWIHEESHDYFGEGFPTVVSFYAKYNNLSYGVIYHNHNAYHLMMGFQDNVARILKNLKIASTEQ